MANLDHSNVMDRGALGTPCGVTLADLVTLRNIQFLARLGTSAQSVKSTESKLPDGKNDRS